jgi:hypothetical protein
MNKSIKNDSSQKIQEVAPLVSRKLFQVSDPHHELNYDKPKQSQNSDLYHKYTNYKGKMIQNPHKKSQQNLKITPKEP